MSVFIRRKNMKCIRCDVELKKVKMIGSVSSMPVYLSKKIRECLLVRNVIV
jgi:hypothetical protein